ncbi:MAG: hypothetical protein V4760_15985 [Bdellovibrionota bacterium]
MRNTWFRTFALTATVASYYLTQPGDGMTQLMWAVGLAHYLVAFVNSRKRYAATFIESFEISKLLGLAMWVLLFATFAAGRYASQIWMIFSLHHVLSEVYLFRSQEPSAIRLYRSTLLPRVLLAAFLFVGFIFKMVIGMQTYAVVSFVLFGCIAGVVVMRRTFGRVERDLLAFELVGILFPLAFWDIKMPLLWVFYHGIIWYPISYSIARTERLKPIVIQVVLAVAIYFALPWITPNATFLRPDGNLFLFFAYFHILTTPFVSNFNPSFWNRFVSRIGSAPLKAKTETKHAA